MIKIGITGQAGFVGYHLFNSLKIDNRFEVVAFEDDFFYNEDVLNNFVKQCDVIVHLAGVNRHTNPNEVYNKNIELADRLIKSLVSTQSKARVLFSSSTQEERNNPYGMAKKESRLKFIEWATKNNNGFVGMIVPNVFGPFGKPFHNSVISTFCHQLIKGDTPKIEVDAEINFIYISELIQFIINLLIDEEEQIIEEIIIPHTYTIKVSEILDKLIDFKDYYYLNGIIPHLKNSFEVQLFNTFRTHINPTDFFPVKYKVNSDNRGDFVEVMKLNIGGQVSFSTTKPGITRGNHFHTRKIERFAVIKGKALIQLRKIGTDEVLNFELDGSLPSYVDMPVWYTHNITNIGEEDLYTLFWINEFFNPEDPDTFFETV